MLSYIVIKCLSLGVTDKNSAPPAVSAYFMVRTNVRGSSCQIQRRIQAGGWCETSPPALPQPLAVPAHVGKVGRFPSLDGYCREHAVVLSPNHSSRTEELIRIIFQRE